MIGCMAKATSDALNVDFDEMEDVRWVTREQAARAVLASQERKNPYPSAPPHVRWSMVRVENTHTRSLHFYNEDYPQMPDFHQMQRPVAGSQGGILSTLKKV